MPRPCNDYPCYGALEIIVGAITIITITPTPRTLSPQRLERLDLGAYGAAVISHLALHSKINSWLRLWLDLVVQRLGVGLVIERSLVRLPAGALSSQLGQLSLPSLRCR